MKWFFRKRTALVLIVVFGLAPTTLAQSSPDFDEQFTWKTTKSRMDSNYSFRGSNIHDPCYNQSGQWTAKDISKHQNYGRCRDEQRHCKKLDSNGYQDSLTGAYKQCVKELWATVDREDWDNMSEIRRRRNNGSFDRYNFDRNSQPGKSPNPPPITQFSPPPKPPAGSTGGRHDYGTDIDDLDASGIEIMDVDEEEESTANDNGKSCSCYAGDYENLGICHTSDTNSYYYGRRNARGELISTYPTGEYPWTSACKHPVGGRVNLQEWHDNYNNK